MTLRAKLLLLLGGIFASLVVVVHGAALFFLQQSVTQLEEQRLTADAQRAQRVLQAAIADLDRTTRAYAFSGVAYTYLQNHEADHAAGLPFADLLAGQGLDFLLLLDKDDNLVLGQPLDPRSNAATTPARALLQAVEPYRQPDREGYRGVLLLPADRAVLLAIHPVLSTPESLSPVGVLIMGRYVDEAESGRRAGLADLALTFQPVSQIEPAHPALIQDLTAANDQEYGSVLVESANRRQLHAYGLISGLDGQPALLYTVSAARPTFLQGLADLPFLSWLLLLAGLTIGGIGLLGMERLVFKRVTQLAGQVSAVAQSGDTGQRVELPGQDELSQLATAISEMISQLDMALAEQKETDEHLQQNLHKTTLLYRVIAAAAALRDPHQVMELVCIELAQALQLPHVTFTLLSSDNESLRVVAGHGPEGKPPSLGLTIPIQENLLIQTALSTGQSVYIANAQTEPRYGMLQEIARQRGTVSAFLVPLIIKNQVVGLLELSAVENREFSSGERDTVESVVRATSRALENARLYAALETELEQRKQAEKELQKAKEWAESANYAKTEFISTISHELRVPLTAIQGFADLMLRQLVGPINEAQERYLQTIISNAIRLNNLISDLSDISRIETGRFNLQFNPVDIYDLIEEAVALTEDQIKRRNHTLELRLQEGIPVVWADRGRLMQILTNLICNAYKFTPNGGLITLSARTTIRKLGPRRGLRVAQITVSDNGIGISPDEQPRVFERFFRSDDDQAREARGTGLGLSIVKNLLELQGGRIWFESSYGQGTTFHFIIPLMDQLDPLESKPPAATFAAPRAAKYRQKSQI